MSEAEEAARVDREARARKTNAASTTLARERNATQVEARSEDAALRARLSAELRQKQRANESGAR